MTSIHYPLGIGQAFRSDSVDDDTITVQEDLQERAADQVVNPTCSAIETASAAATSVPPKRDWTFRARRHDVDITRILRESYEAGSREVQIFISAQVFTFIAEEVIANAVYHGFRSSDVIGEPAAAYYYDWNGSNLAMIPDFAVAGHKWCCTAKPILHKVRKWTSRPIEVRVRGRA